MSPLDENHQALVIRLYRLAGDDAAAAAAVRRLRASCSTRELGVAPGCGGAKRRGTSARSAASRPPPTERGRRGRRGRVGRGRSRARSRPGHRLAARPPCGSRTRAGSTHLRVQLAAGAGRGADPLAARPGRGGAGRAARGGPDRRSTAATWPRWRRPGPSSATSTSCAPATTGPSCGSPMRCSSPTDSPPIAAKATTYLGSVDSDRGDYPRAVALLDEAVRLARGRRRPAQGGVRACPCCGRVDLLRGDLDAAADAGRARSRWPSATTGSRSCPGRRRCRARSTWPAATVRGRGGRSSRRSPGPASSATRAGRASRRAGSPWSPRRRGDTDQAFDAARDARTRAGRLADPLRLARRATSSTPCARSVAPTSTR